MAARELSVVSALSHPPNVPRRRTACDRCSVPSPLAYSGVVNLDDLTGATLDQITIDWRNGIARATFLASSRMKESCALRLTGVVRVDVTRSAKASRHVRAVHRVDAPGVSPARVEITLESGERLAFEAASIEIDPIGG